MKTHSVLRLTVLLFALAFKSTPVFAEQTINTSQLESVFAKHNAVGTFALYDHAQDQWVIINEPRANERKIPASTFKIANSLIALEIKAVRDENEVIPYGGAPQHFKSWEQDMSMRDAIKISNLPVFQELARRIGHDQYRKWLKLFQFGNGATGQDVKTFWLKGPLKISAVEQVKFLTKLATKNLPLSNQTQTTVTDIIRIGRKGERVLFGKTGWSAATSPQLGWFVGWVKNERGNFPFALNMDINSKADAEKRKRIARAILRRLDVF